MLNVALVFAGGVGSRMGNEIPKQFLEWNNKAIIIHTLEVFENSDEIDRIVLVCKEEWIEYTNTLIQKAGLQKIGVVVPGGATALDSQYIGLEAIKKLYPDEEVVVLIHDGVRPLLDEETIHHCIEGVKAHGNAITVTCAIETVITINDHDEVENILDRNICRMAKAPQCFKLNDILELHQRAILEGKHDYIDSATMMMAYGRKLHVVIGKPENIKITTPSDYFMFLGISKNRDKEKEI